MTPEEFIDKWRNVETTERASAQSHFIDLCRLLGVRTPTEDDPRGIDYAFEKRVTKPGGRSGYADVWKRGCFAWEYKGAQKNLVAAYSQLKDYADALENPPLLIVSDMREIRIHTNFTNTVAQTHVIALADLNSVEHQRLLRRAFAEPDKLRPTETREGVTTKAAAAFGRIAQKLRDRGYDPHRVAHFLNKLVFCLFVEDIDLLPERVFAGILEDCVKRPQDFAPMLGDLFRAMRERDGRFGRTHIPWFNGGLFDGDEILPLGFLDIRDLADASRLDWSQIEPAIFGTLFEKGLDPDRRKEMAGLFDAADKASGGRKDAQLRLLDNPVADRGVGIHYTDPATIMKLVEPVVLRPLRAEWEAAKAKISDRRAARDRAGTGAAKTRAENEARGLYVAFRERLGQFRVLDPACGSGNFLYLALRHLKDFDAEVLDEAGKLGLPVDD